MAEQVTQVPDKAKGTQKPRKASAFRLVRVNKDGLGRVVVESHWDVIGAPASIKAGLAEIDKQPDGDYAVVTIRELRHVATVQKRESTKVKVG